ncbi:hypothetical protein CASFOL_041217 [Castilleja foliolosa]|uniref:F-box domain-containing protein n=1 Tax=Castilleja foliolosa TaxID=1961234 RepID=A0ABD3BER6_9LAMI
MESTVLTTEEEDNNSEITGSGNCSHVAGQKHARYVTNISSLPDDIMFDILVRLPAQDIYDTARLVCPSWLKIIRTRDFYRAHIQQSTYGLLIQHRDPDYDQPVFFSTQNYQIEISYFSHKRKVLSSCNGLLLDYLDIDKKDLYISNPATKRCFALPQLYANNRPFGFAAMAYAAASNEYKVVRTSSPYFNVHPRFRCCAVLTVGVDKDWTQTEIFTVHHVPRPLRYDGEKYFIYRYLPMGSHLSMLIGRSNTFSWELWIMKPETGEWTNVTTSIDLEGEKLWTLNCRLEPVGWSNLREVLVFKVRKLNTEHDSQSYYTRFGLVRNHTRKTQFFIAYNVCTHEIVYFELECDKSTNHFIHRNSLIWMDRVPFLNEDGESNSNNSDVIRDDLDKRKEYLDSVRKNLEEMINLAR